MAKLKMTASVVSQAQLAEGIYDLRLNAQRLRHRQRQDSLYPSIPKTAPVCFQDPSASAESTKRPDSCVWYIECRGRHRRVFCIEGRG